METLCKKLDSGLPAGHRKSSWTDDNNVSKVDSPASRLFTVKDELSNHELLVDTGAFVSIFPASSIPNQMFDKAVIPHLVAANGSSIKTFGKLKIRIRLSGKDFTWDFVIADVRQALLGADFLGNFRLMVDIAGRRLLNVDSFQSLPLMTDRSRSSINSTVHFTGQFAYLFEKYRDVFRAELKQVPGTKAKHGIYHHITTTGPPVHSRFRRLAPEKLAVAKAAFAEMERMGVCRKAGSQWSSPLHMVPKSDGTWRPCGDYRRLNLQTVPDHYPLPNISDITATINGAKVFSKLDLLKGYFQVPVHPDDVDKTCIITPFGSFVFHYSTFGLRNAGATFQRLMDTIIGELPFCIVYVDDILVFSKSEKEHHQHLRTVLEILQQNGLVVRPDKCTFGVPSVDFLGHRIDSNGICPNDGKVNAVKHFPVPSSIKSLQEYVGLINYYHRFVPNLAGILKPLYDSLSGKSKSFVWNEEQQKAFEASKRALASVTYLHHPVSGAKLVLTTDASSKAVGAVLEQVIDGVHQPLAFFSKKLRQNETKYSTFDRELLAVYLALRHFQHNLEGTSFIIRTDHRPLVTALTKTKDAFSARQQRQLSVISEFSCELQYISGKRNPAADALSRAPIDSVHFGIDLQELAVEQRSDPDYDNYETLFTSLNLRNIPVYKDVSIICDISTKKPRPLVPPTLRKKFFKMIHGLNHPSARSTVRLMTSKFVWHGISKDVREWVRSCDRCQRSKVIRHVESGINQFPSPKRRFSHIHVDVVGPLPTSNDCRYLFTVIDRSTRWPEAVPMQEATSKSCAEAFLNNWISRFGVPEFITSDRGTTFTSDLWKNLARLMGCRLNFTTAFNPESNGMVERFHRSLKQALIARCSNADWYYQLPWTLLGLRTTPKVDTGTSTA